MAAGVAGEVEGGVARKTNMPVIICAARPPVTTVAFACHSQNPQAWTGTGMNCATDGIEGT